MNKNVSNNILDYIKYQIYNDKVTITKCDKSISGNVTIPDAIEGCPVTTVDDFAFNECNSLKSIKVPDTVTKIGAYAFSNCSSLESLKLSKNITSIPNGMLFNATSIKSCEIPDGVTNIGSYAFHNCLSLANLTMSDGVESIQNFAFSKLPSDTTLCVLNENGKVLTSFTVGELRGNKEHNNNSPEILDNKGTEEPPSPPPPSTEDIDL